MCGTKPMFKVHGVKKVRRSLDDVRKRQMPYATMLAINETLNYVRNDIRDEIKLVFDRPTPFTLRGVLTKYATKRTLYGETYLRDEAVARITGLSAATPAIKYLRPAVEASQRNVKGFERALISAGVMPQGWYALPGKSVRLNKYGNMTSGLIVKILSDVRALRGVPTSGKGRPKTKRRLMKYFAVKPGGHPTLKPGVYKRMAKGVKPVLIFTPRRPQYKKRLDYYGVGKATIRKRYGPAFRKGWKRAMATARR